MVEGVGVESGAQIAVANGFAASRIQIKPTHSAPMTLVIVVGTLPWSAYYLWPNACYGAQGKTMEINL
jgi:hypothetical protein